MLVCKQDSIELRDIFADGGQPPGELAPTDSGINEHARAIGCQENRITETAACENADLKDGRLPAAARVYPAQNGRFNWL